MNSLNRIKSNKISVGKAFVVGSSVEKEINVFKECEKIISEAKEKASIEADEILTKAREKAEQIAEEIVENAKKEAQEQSEKILETARIEGEKQGYEEGFQKGENEIRKKLEDDVLNVENFAKSTFEIKNKILKDAYSEVLELSLQIASSICKKTLQIDETALESMIKNAILNLEENETVKIVINPLMYEKISKISANLSSKISNLKTIQIVTDPKVLSTSFIVETKKSRIDASIESQIENMKEALFSHLQEVKNISENNNDD